jgi:hypothetical protein
MSSRPKRSEVEGSAFSSVCVGTNAETYCDELQTSHSNLMPQPSAPSTARRQTERRRQIRGLLLVAIAILVFSILRAGPHNIFTPGWWRLW